MAATPFSLAVGKSFALHLAMGTLLVVSMDFHTPPAPPQMALSQPIEAVAIDESALQQQMQQIQKQKDDARKQEQARIAELEKRAKDAERKRKEEEARVKKIRKQKDKELQDKKRAEQAAADARRKQQTEKEKAEKAERERKRKEAERKKAEEKARKAKEKREAEEKRLKEAERKRQQEAERKAQERALQQQLEAEQAVRAAQRGKYVLSEKEKYTALIYQAIKNKLLVDDYMKGKSCTVRIQLATTGFVVNAQVQGGDTIVCRATESAVLKAGKLPMSQEADVYNELKDIRLIIKL